MTVLLFYFFVLVSSVATRAAPGCTYIRGWCYLYKADYASFSEAEEQCAQLGGHLASVHSSDDLYAVQNLAKKYTYTYNIWLGGQRRHNVWAWTDGTSFNYHPWAVGEPGGDCIASSGDITKDATVRYGAILFASFSFENGQEGQAAEALLLY